MNPLLRLLAPLLLLPAALPAATETIPLDQLPEHARLAIWGDSITEQRIYSVYTETYLLACAGRADVSVCTFGHDGETLGALLTQRIDLEAFHPTVIAFNYGMNDARDAIPWSEAKGVQFEQTLGQVLDMLAAKGIGRRIIAGPGLADAPPRQATDAATAGSYDHNIRQRNLALGHFRDIGLATARKAGTAFADINHSMAETLERARRTQPEYSFLDIHPAPNGHLMMAIELLKALGCGGEIGTVTVDLRGATTASAGHVVVGSADGVVTLDSSRYPFCCSYRDDSSPASLASVLPYLPFQQELNRLVLKVANLGADSAEVVWGGESRTFTAAQLAAGINLAQEFAHTPFDAQFARVLEAVVDKQRFELFLSKGTSNYFGNDAGGNVDANMIAIQAEKDAAVKALLTPVRHTLAIVPAGKARPVIPPMPAAPPSDAVPQLPAITSAKTASAVVGQPFSYRIEASNAPSAYFAWAISDHGTTPPASSLPAGLGYDRRTGIVSGTPTAAGVFTVSIAAMNRGGVGAGTVELTVAASP